jgi:hypothetical protein
MGYYTNIVNSTCVLPAKNKDKAYKILCDLNNRNDLKTGGLYPQPANPPKNKPYPEKWFSWMDWNYHETCKTVEEIFQALGFDVATEANGDVRIENYDSKTDAKYMKKGSKIYVTGTFNEDVFFKAIAKLLKGEIKWHGEDDSTWKWIFSSKGMKTMRGFTVYR